jgi:hypothetical protein
MNRNITCLLLFSILTYSSRAQQAYVKYKTLYGGEQAILFRTPVVNYSKPTPAYSMSSSSYGGAATSNNSLTNSGMGKAHGNLYLIPLSGIDKLISQIGSRKRRARMEANTQFHLYKERSQHWLDTARIANDLYKESNWFAAYRYYSYLNDEHPANPYVKSWLINQADFRLYARALFNTIMIEEDLEQWQMIKLHYNFKTSDPRNITFTKERDELTNFENFRVDFAYCKALFYLGSADSATEKWNSVFKYIKIRTDEFVDDPNKYIKFLVKGTEGLMMFGTPADLKAFLDRFLKGAYSTHTYKHAVADKIVSFYQSSPAKAEPENIRLAINFYQEVLKNIAIEEKDIATYNLALAYFLAADYTKSESLLSPLLNNTILFENAYLLNQTCLIKTKKQGLAIASIDSLLKTNLSKDSLFRHELMSLRTDAYLTECFNYNEAGSAFIYFKDAFPQKTEPLIQIGKYHYHCYDKLDHAQTYFEICVSQDPDNITANIYLASIYAKLNETDNFNKTIKKLHALKVEISSDISVVKNLILKNQ